MSHIGLKRSSTRVSPLTTPTPLATRSSETSRIMAPLVTVSRTILRPSCEDSLRLFVLSRLMMRPCDLVVPCLRVPAAERIVEALRPPPLLYTSPKGMCPIYPDAPATLTPCYLSTYLVADSIPLYYYTEVIGDARNPPTILASPSFNFTSALAIFGKASLPSGQKGYFSAHAANRRRSIHSWWERESVVCQPE